MTPKGPSGSLCPGPGCTHTLTQKSGSGRPRLYCSEICGARYRKANPRGDSGTDALAAIADVGEFVARMRQATTSGNVQSALEAYLEFERSTRDIRNALVYMGRERKLKNTEIASILHVSPSTLTRSLTADSGHRERRTPSPRSAPPTMPLAVPVPRQRHPEPGPPRSRRPAGGTGEKDGGAQGPGAVLASALSHLHRLCERTHRDLAAEVGVDSSYISRILSGERLPSWRVTRGLSQACGADPEDLRPLWNAARGYRAVQPDTLSATLRGLHLAAARPPVDLLQTRAQLPADDIAALLAGVLVPDWSAVDRLVTALNGQPDTIRPLWEAAQRVPAHGSPRTASVTAGGPSGPSAPGIPNAW